MKAIVVGAGGVARDLLRRLGEIWDVTLVDVAAERLSRFESRPAAVEGDGSSRVVLARAGLDGADAVVAATSDDEVNLEVCRLALEAGVRRLVAVAARPESLEDYRRIGVTAVSPHRLAARRVELNLETRRVSSMAFADGRAEAIEFRVASDSPVRGQALKDLHAHSFIVGAVLRGDRLIVPHGDTVLEAGDLVTVVGAGADFADIVRTFTAGRVRFPLDFGKRVAVALTEEQDLDGCYREAVQLVRGSRASSVLLVHRNPDSVREETRAETIRAWVERAPRLADGVEVRFRPVEYSPARALASLPREESIGVIVRPARRGRAVLARLRAGDVSLVRRTRRPVLISRGTAPYRRILVPARGTPAGRAAARAAIDLARLARAELRALVVEDFPFLARGDGSVESRHAISWLEEEAAAQGVRVQGTVQRGNPVRTLVRVAEGAALVVLGVDLHHRPLSGGPGIAGPVARRAAGSVLLVPA